MHVFFFTIVLITLRISTYLCVVCCHNICLLLLLFQSKLLVRNVPLQGLWCWLKNQGAAEYFFAIPALKLQPLNFLFSRTRQENKAKGLAFLRAGNRQQALECFQKCVDISPEMALEVIKVLMLLFVFLIALYS